MIHLVCPKCKSIGTTAQTIVRIRVPTYVGVVFNSGIEYKVRVPMRAPSNGSATDLEVTTMTCNRCGMEAKRSDWRLALMCDGCGKTITDNANEDNIPMFFCRDTRSVFCNKCWESRDRVYCKECMYRDRCGRKSNDTM